jgi:hypothetical protein
MKLLQVLTVFLTLTLSSSSALAVGDDGYASVGAAADAFLSPLTKGVAGVPGAISALPGQRDTKNPLIAEAKKTLVENPLQSTLVGTMRVNGKLMGYRKTSESVSMGGKVVKQFYELAFLNGPKKQLMLRIMQPTLSGGYHIMDAQITDPVDMNAIGASMLPQNPNSNGNK